MTKQSIEDWIGASIGVGVVLPIFGSIGVGILSILWQCVTWLKLAAWQALTLRDGFIWWIGPKASYYLPQTGYLGVDRILLWALDSSPLAIWLIVICPMFWMLTCLLFCNGLLSTIRSDKLPGLVAAAPGFVAAFLRGWVKIFGAPVLGPIYAWRSVGERRVRGERIGTIVIGFSLLWSFVVGVVLSLFAVTITSLLAYQVWRGLGGD